MLRESKKSVELQAPDHQILLVGIMRVRGACVTGASHERGMNWLEINGFSVNFRHLMRSFLTWLLVLGVVVGLGNRVLALDPCDSQIEAAAGGHSGHHHDHDSDHPCDPTHDQQCPVEHHHAVCGHMMPLVSDHQAGIVVGGAMFSRLLMCVENATLPETPVYELDKPPLI